MDLLEAFNYRGSFSNLQAALEEHQVSALEGEIATSPHQQDNTIVKEHGMDDIKDTLAQRLEQQKAKLDKIVTHRRRILRLDNHWRVQEDQARNIISHGQSLLWAIDSTTQENQDDTAS